MERDLGEEGRSRPSAEEACESVLQVLRVIIFSGQAEVCDGVGGRVIVPPVVEAAAVREATTARIRPTGAVVGRVIVAKVDGRIPLDSALVVGGGRRRDLDGAVETVETVRAWRRGQAAVCLAVVIQRAQVPLATEE